MVGFGGKFALFCLVDKRLVGSYGVSMVSGHPRGAAGFLSHSATK